MTMRFAHRALLICLTISIQLSALGCFPTGSSGGSSPSTPGPGPGEQDEECYQNTTVGCSEITWSDVVAAIEAIYYFHDTYNGYTKEEALELAQVLYDNGVYPESYLRILAVRDLGGGEWQAFVTVTGQDGYPAGDLLASDFAISLDGGEPFQPESIKRLRQAATGEMGLDAAVVVDDSGSVADCDANFVAQGMAYLFETLPRIYEAELIKFDQTIHLAQDWTGDGEELSHAMLHYCTSRGSTALWDALDQGIDDMRGVADVEAVVVFTDGMDNSSQLDLEDVIDAAEARGVPVFVIGLGMADIFSLIDLAWETGGGFVYIYSGERILEAFETLTEFVLDTYVLTFSADGDFSEIAVSAVTGESLEVSHSLTVD